MPKANVVMSLRVQDREMYSLLGFFNTFINDLLEELGSSEDRVCIGTSCVNSFTYADDFNLICTTVSGLQSLIDKCSMYASTWRF